MRTPYTKYTNITSSMSSMSTTKSAPTTTNFAKGIYTYKPNDLMGYDEILLAENARFDRVGEYKTRRGLKRISTPIGWTSALSTYGGQTDITIAETIDSATFETALYAPANGVICSVYTPVRRIEAVNGYAVPQITLWQADTEDGEREELGVACFDPANFTSAGPAEPAWFNNLPKITKDYFGFTLSYQDGDYRAYGAVTTQGTGELQLQAWTCDDGKVGNIFEANINGTKTILFTFTPTVGNTKLYRLDGENPVLIRTLPAGVEKVRFNQDLNQIRYADGKEGPRLIDPGNNWSDTAIVTEDLDTGVDLGIKVSNIMDGTNADNIIYFNSDVDTEAIWTWAYGYKPSGTAINSYDKFSRDFYQNFPAINTGDPLTAMANLGGVYYFFTRRNKYQMYAQTADTWTQSQSTAQNGTFSQESVVCDLNSAYFASDNGIYIFDGASEYSLTQNTIQNVYDAIKNKESIVLDLYENRLYVYYDSDEDGENDSALVYNINLRVWESFDTGTYVSATSARQNASNRFICGHSRMGLIMLNEAKDNNYADLSAPIYYNLETAYQHFGSTSQLKRITKWRPEFATSENPYNVQCGYSLDFNEKVKYAFSVNLKNNQITTENYNWDNLSKFGVRLRPTKHTTIPRIYEEFYRCQLRYQHIAAYEPVTFKSHTLTIQTQRIR